MSWSVAALYRFTPLAHVPELRADLTFSLGSLNVFGTLLLASEGFNGTLAAQAQDFDAMLKILDTRLGLAQAEVKFSSAAAQPFKRLKVRAKREIITLCAPEADPSHRVGQHVSTQEWNALLDDPNVLLIDTRNDYEVEAGRFTGAVDPGLKTFTDFKAYAATLDPKQKIAMYCTGGIRCEKASAYLLAHGFKDVYQLKGGILKYLEDVPSGASRWQGSCFVFDDRGALAHGLKETARS